MQVVSPICFLLNLAQNVLANPKLCLRDNPVGVQIHRVELIAASTQHVQAFFLLRSSGGVLCDNGKGGRYL
jgi:hypothetical protein